MADMANPTGKHRKKRRHHGEGTVIERRDHWRRSTWAAVVPYRDESGRRRTMWRSAPSEEAAEELRKELVRKLAAVPAKSLVATLHDYAAEWLEGKRDMIAPSTHTSYRGHLERRILPTMGTVPLADLTVAGIRQASLRWEGAAATRATSVMLLKSILRDAERDGLLPDNPARYLKPPRIVRKPATTVDVDAARHLLETAKGERNYPALVMMLGLGLRRGEVLGLQTSMVDLKAGVVRIEGSLRPIPAEFRAEGEDWRRIVAPKHGSYRVLPLPDFVAEALRVRLEERDAERRAAKVWAGNDLVFCSPVGNPITFSVFGDWFTRLCKRAGLPRMHPHEMRHSAATILLAEGVDVRVVQAILGHKTVEQTAHYAKVLPRVSREATAKMGRAIG